MKKKILIISMAVNVLVGAFVLMAFTSKTNKGDGNPISGGYVMVSNLSLGLKAKLVVSDGEKVIEETDLKTENSIEKIEDNHILVLKKLNEMKASGFTLVSTNTIGGIENYLFEKK